MSDIGKYPPKHSPKQTFAVFYWRTDKQAILDDIALMIDTLLKGNSAGCVTVEISRPDVGTKSEPQTS